MSTVAPEDAPEPVIESFVHGWLHRGDTIQPEHYPAHFSADEAYFDYPADVQRSVSYATKFGSVPGWLQSSGESPSGYRFLGQITENYDFYRVPKGDLLLSEWQTRPNEDSERNYEIDAFNFGAGGTAYLFCEDSESDVPRIHRFWQY